MKKVVLTGLLAVASAISISQFAAAQADITLPPAEANAYNTALGQTAPAAKAQALEAFLTQYPNTKVKTYALEQLVQAYMGTGDSPKIIAAADRLLQADPNNLRGLAMEVFFRKQAADPLSDAAAKKAGLDEAASYAEKGLAAFGNKPQGMAQQEFDQLKAAAVPQFYSTIADDDLQKNDAAGAVENFKKELAAMPEAQTGQMPWLIDEFLLGQAYMQQKDYLNCSFYTGRAAALGQDPLKTAALKTSQYCYQKYHGKLDGYDAVQAAASKSLNPPADFSTTVTPAPSPAQLAHDALAGGDGSNLAIGDREFILANGSTKDASGQTDADKVWQAMKGKSYTIPDAVVIASSPTQLQVAVSEDAQQNKVADVTVQLTPPTPPEEPTSKAPAAQARYKREMAAFQKQQDAATAATAVGNKVTFSGTYDSYTTTPSLMITMTGGEVQMPKAAPAPAARGGRGAGRRGGGRR